MRAKDTFDVPAQALLDFDLRVVDAGFGAFLVKDGLTGRGQYGDTVWGQAGYRGGDKASDGQRLPAFEGLPPYGAYDDRCRCFRPILRKRFALRQDQVDTGVGDHVHAFDRLDQFPLQRAQAIDLLQEAVHADSGRLVEKRPSGRIRRGQARFCQSHPSAGNVAFGQADDRAVVRIARRKASALQFLDDLPCGRGSGIGDKRTIGGCHCHAEPKEQRKDKPHAGCPHQDQTTSAQSGEVVEEMLHV